MNEIFSFFKDIITGKDSQGSPIGLCGFECEGVQTAPKAVKPKRKNEMRLSELMDK